MNDQAPSHQAQHTQDGVRHTLEIVVSAESMAEQVEQVAQAYRGRVRVPGFRQGKAPLSMVRQQFGDEIRQKVLDHAIPDYLRREMEKLELEPIGSPALETLEYSSGEPLKFVVLFDTAPEVVVGQKDFTVGRAEGAVSEADIDASLEQLRDRAASLVPVEDGIAATGNFARCQISLLPKDGKGKRLAEENRFVLIGEEKSIPGLNAQLEGMETNQDREFVTELADEFPNAILAGKEVLCRVRIEDLKQRQLPALDEDLAKELGFETLDALRDKTRDDLATQMKENAEREVENQLLEQFRTANPVQVPEALIEPRLDEMVRRFAGDIANQGVDPRSAVDWAAFREQSRGHAEQSLADELLLDQLASDEQIEVDDATVQAEIQRQLDNREGGNQRTAASLTQQMRKDGSFDSLRLTLRRRLALEHLKGHATIDSVVGDQNTGATRDSA